MSASHLPYAQYLTHEFQWPPLAHAYISYIGSLGRTSFQLLSSLFTAPSTAGDYVNIPSVYSMMKFVYLFDCSLF